MLKRHHESSKTLGAQSYDDSKKINFQPSTMKITFLLTKKKKKKLRNLNETSSKADQKCNDNWFLHSICPNLNFTEVEHFKGVSFISVRIKKLEFFLAKSKNKNFIVLTKAFVRAEKNLLATTIVGRENVSATTIRRFPRLIHSCKGFVLPSFLLGHTRAPRMRLASTNRLSRGQAGVPEGWREIPVQLLLLGTSQLDSRALRVWVSGIVCHPRSFVGRGILSTKRIFRPCSHARF